MRRSVPTLRLPSGTPLLAALLCCTLALGACNYGRQETLTARVHLPLSPAECTRLTDPRFGGGPMAGTLVAVAGAEFPPLTRFDQGVHPCAGGGADTEVLLDLQVDVPEGGKRALALAVLGPVLDLGNVNLPETVIGELPLRLQTPRTVFFGGGEILDETELAAATVTVVLDPFVNLLGLVTSSGVPTPASITFYLPEQDGPCLRNFDTLEDPAVVEAVTVAANENGRFFAPVPYRAVGEFCLPSHGSELYGFARTPRGEVALVVPGRAEVPGAGLEPGMLLTDVRVLPRTPAAIRQALLPVVTAVSRVPAGGVLRLQLSGFGLDGLSVGQRIPITLRSAATAIDTNLSVESVALMGQNAGDVPFASYARIREAGGGKAPGTITVEAVDDLGATIDLGALSAGDYQLSLRGPGVFELDSISIQRR